MPPSDRIKGNFNSSHHAAQAKPPSKAVEIRLLSSELEQIQQQYDVLLAENASLRTREEVLLQQVTQQGDNLHFVALAAAQTDTRDVPDMAKTLMQDLEVYELLELLGRSSSSQGDEPFTTQRLRAAVTPERVAAMRNTTVEEVAAHLKQLTMRMCMLLTGGPHKAHLFSDSIEAVVNEYGEYGLLLHVAADWVALQIGVLNLDTLQAQEPPPGYWESVADNLELQEPQVQTLTTGFDNYQQKSKPIIAALHSSVSSIHAILNLEHSQADSSMQNQQPAHSEARQEQPAWASQHKPFEFGGSSNTANNNTGSPSSNLQSQPCPMDCSVSPSPASAPKPWQQFGLSQGCLTAEMAEELEQHMSELMQNVMKLREMHRTVTWLFLNTLNARQHALFITGSWPWWSRPLTMCQYIAEKHGRHLKGSQRQDSGGTPRSSGNTAPPASADRATAAVADGIWHLQLGVMQQGISSGTTAAAQQGVSPGQ